MRRSPCSRQRQSLPTLLDQRLITYTLAAGAAGVSLVALAQPSDAEVVYTPAHIVIARSGSFDMDPSKPDRSAARMTRTQSSCPIPRL